MANTGIANNLSKTMVLTTQLVPGVPNIGAPGREQFADAQVQLRNRAIITFLGEVFIFREEFLGDDSLQARSGTDDATLINFLAWVKRLDEARRFVSDQPEGTDLQSITKLMGEAVDVTKNVTDATTTDKAPTTTAAAAAAVKEIKGPGGSMVALPWALDGSDPNVPLNSQLALRNPQGMIVLMVLDFLITSTTRCEDRFLTGRITPQTSLMLYKIIADLYAAITQMAGASNRMLITSGTRRSEEPRGPQAAPNVIGETPGTLLAGQAAPAAS